MTEDVLRRRLFYKLVGHDVISCESHEDWARWFETFDNGVTLTELGGAVISTIFLGIDHRYFGDGAPLVFETAIDRGEGFEITKCTSTWSDAEAAHQAAVEIVRKRLH